ncbi:MAG: class I SAM-dependent methyltransferase [Planctomycetes bacterium]|nr:class I SAM-dependent methyltransferase [Planctomycetota bacterium]
MTPEKMRVWLKERLTPEQRVKLQKWANSSSLLRWYYGANLPALATIYGTNKWRDHWYAQHYQFHFQKFRRRKMNILEIGVGGYENPRAGGDSLRMWKAYFPRAHIFSLDIHDKSAVQEHRITIFKGSQNDPEFLQWVAKQIGRIELIIDDGSHCSEHVITSFKTLFPALADGGIYAIEDLQFSYWPDFGGTDDPHCETTSMWLCKQLIDGLNWQEFRNESPSYTDRNIKSAHFYHNLAFFYKALNEEKSGMSAAQRQEFSRRKFETIEKMHGVPQVATPQGTNTQS